MDRFDALKLFTRVVELNSFSKAARETGLSRPSVSKQISQLEHTLDVQLLNRSTRHVSPTATGSAYYERAKQILADMEEADSSVRQLETTASGTLRLNAPLSFGSLHLATAIANFMARYPEIAIDATLTDRFIDPVQEGYDLTLRIAELKDSSLIASRITPIRRVLCASPDYLKHMGEPVHPKELQDHDCLHYGNLATGNDWHFNGPDGPEKVTIKGKLCSNNAEILHQAALAGQGITFLPTFLVGPDLQTGALSSVLCEFRPQPLALHALYAANRQLSARSRLFIDFLKARFGPEPYWDLVS